ncbi:hypothetical protein AeMF1_015860 [Aphanomyces euteiches]|nr:hypothetical protein AeMF1_015860 [Aphanomyces euteiches]KAH9191137.1 hypothetical protein AeNC1_006892 [Aphanomyces euteiches]
MSVRWTSRCLAVGIALALQINASVASEDSSWASETCSVEDEGACQVKSVIVKDCSSNAKLHFILGRRAEKLYNHGYNTAKIFRRKFTYISPVWYQIRHDDKRQPTLTGRHDIDAKWIDDVRGESNGPRIVPRFMFEMNSLSHQEARTIVRLVRKEVQDHGFDGVTLEVSSSSEHAFVIKAQIPVLEITVNFIQELGKGLQEDDKILIAVLPTSQRDGRLSTPIDLIKKMLPFVHRFSVNAYDYSSSGPNAPLPWLETTIDALASLQSNQKFLMGLAFYGYDTNQAVVAHQYRELLKTHKPSIKWDTSAHECYFQYGDHRTVYYPCLQSIQDRLQLYASAQTGAAIWDIGQGLDYFFDLL